MQTEARKFGYEYHSAKVSIIVATVMNTFRHNIRVCLGLCLFLSLVTQPWEFACAQSVARLVIRRAPDLGRNVIVQLSIDGRTVAAITYGHTYETAISAGTHSIAVAPAPNAKWKSATSMTLNAHSGQTYTLTARNDNSGHLTLLKRS